jgi:hypothetical protein
MQAVWDHPTDGDQSHGREVVPRRYPKLAKEAIDKAASLYHSGSSLNDIGKTLSVDPGTVRRALIKHGIRMRDPQGQERFA